MSDYDPKGNLSLYFHDINKVERLSFEEEHHLVVLAFQGDEAARTRLVEAHLWLVVLVAQEYEGFGLPLLDLIAEGNIGLMIGVDKLDPKKVKKARSYLRYRIRGAITEALTKQAKTVRLPSHIVKGISRLRRMTFALKEELGREPTVEELSRKLKIKPADVVMLQNEGKSPLFLDEPIDKDNPDGARIEDIIADESEENHPLHTASKSSLHNRLMLALDQLEDGERQVIEELFGLNGETPKNLREVGEMLGRVRETVRNRKEKALAKLRSILTSDESPEKGALEIFLTDFRRQVKSPQDIIASRKAQFGGAATVSSSPAGETSHNKNISMTPREGIDCTPGLRILPLHITCEKEYQLYLDILTRDLLTTPLHIELFRGYCEEKYIPSRSLGRARIWDISVGPHPSGQRGRAFVRLGVFLSPMVQFKLHPGCSAGHFSLAEKDFIEGERVTAIHLVLADIKNIVEYVQNHL